MIQLVKGFKDILPGEVEIWQHIEKKARHIFESFGFNEIRPPIVEKTELFKRSIGEDTDIVEKEMFTFPSGKKDLVTLRPEATASVVRSYIQHKLYVADPVRKLYTIGPMFRRERPQKGRYRQFYQINAEVFGVESPYIDAQLILMLTHFLKELSVSDANAHINSLGCPACRPDFRAALSDYIGSVKSELCEDCTKRSDRNPLRVLDCKVLKCRQAMVDAPELIEYLCDDCKAHFDTVQNTLERRKIPFELDKRLVRGLDYYTRTTFEIQSGLLGAQNAIAGGGRYDGLIEILGGPAIPAIGFAVGFDRLVETVALNTAEIVYRPDVFIAALGEECRSSAFDWASQLSLAGVKTEIDFSDRSLKSLMKRANKLNAAHVLIVGERELEEGTLILRNMSTKDQVDIPVGAMVESIKSAIK